MNAPPVCAHCGEVAPVSAARFCERCGEAFGSHAAGVIPSGATRCKCETSDYDEEDVCRKCGLLRRVDAAVTHMPDIEVVVDDRLAFASDKGRKYIVNQDSGAVDRRADGAVLMVVADGVSTTSASDTASNQAVAAARTAFHHASGSPAEQARACVLTAAQAVFDLQKAMMATPVLGEAPSTTIVLTILTGVTAVFAWIGDSRGYVIERSGARLLTKDDSWAADVVSQGLASREDASQATQAHAITQWLGAPLARLDIHIVETALLGCEAVVLCTDGLWNYLDSPGQFATTFRVAAREGVAANICRTLVDHAFNAGGHDNISLAVCLL